LIEYVKRHLKAISSGGRALDPNVAQQVEQNRDNMVH
jgi:hypothetical protein